MFEAERSRPARDLIAAIPDPGPCNAIDLGCGPGNSTELLKTAFPHASITGLDSSPDMIAAAKARLPSLDFITADIETWSGQGPYGIILGNASLQWLPDHQTLFPNLAAKLAKNGTLAIQMPDNLEEPAHRLMREIAATAPWSTKLASATAARAQLPPAQTYYDLLRPYCGRVEIWRTTYHHTLAGPAALIDWFKGTGLRPFLAPLDEPEQKTFLARYQAELAKAYPPQDDGTVLLPFPRLFIVATR
jgi:trans-aconitate 2-methyltransferase